METVHNLLFLFTVSFEDGWKTSHRPEPAIVVIVVLSSTVFELGDPVVNGYLPGNSMHLSQSPSHYCSP